MIDVPVLGVDLSEQRRNRLHHQGFIDLLELTLPYPVPFAVLPVPKPRDKEKWPMQHLVGVRVLGVLMSLERAKRAEPGLLWQLVEGPGPQIVLPGRSDVVGDTQFLSCPPYVLASGLKSIWRQGS